MKMCTFLLSTGVLSFLVCLLPALAQADNYLPITEEALLIQYEGVIQTDPFERQTAAENFLDSFCMALKHEGAFDYSFKKLNKIGSVYSPDNRLRIITWNIPFGLDEQLYFGVALYSTRQGNGYKLVKLTDPLGRNQLRKISKWELPAPAGLRV